MAAAQCIITVICRKALKRLAKSLWSRRWVKIVKRSPQLSTVNKSSRPLLEPWMCWIPASFWFCSEVFYSLRPHGAGGRIKDWWELSESVYCSRDPRMCYEWEDCVAVFPHRSSWGWHSTEVFDNQGWIVFFSSLFFSLSADSLWIARELWVGHSRVYSDVKCDEMLVVSGREAFIFP